MNKPTLRPAKKSGSCRSAGNFVAAVAFLAAALLVPGAAQAATFAVSGTTLAINLTAANENVAITSAGSTYAFALTGGTWSGTDGGGATGNGTALLTATAASFTAVTVDDGSSGNAVTFNTSGANTYASSFTVTLDDATAGTITFNGNTAFAGSSALSTSTSRNISVASGAVVSVVDGNLSLSANQQVTPTSGNFVGIDVNAAAVQTAGTGNVILSGKGGNATSGQIGVRIQAGGSVRSTSASSAAGTISLSGAGNKTTGGLDQAMGIQLSGNATAISSIVGNIQLTGSGGNTGTGGAGANRGIHLTGGAQVTSIGTGAGAASITINATGGTGNQLAVGMLIDTASVISSVDGAIQITTQGGSVSGAGSRGLQVNGASQIKSTGNGSVTVAGTGGTGTNNRIGVDIGGTGSVIAVVNGTLNISGTGGAGGSGSGSRGVAVTSGGKLSSSGSGSVIVTGVEGSNTTNFGLDVTSAASPTIEASGGGTITLIADQMNFDSNAVISAAGSTVALRQRTNGRTIGVGGTDSAAQLGLTDAELDRITAGTVQIGNANSGAITVGAVISPANYKTLAIGNNVTFAAAGGFSADVGPTSASYEKIDVSGTVAITSGATLALAATGGYVWNGTDNFTLLANDASDAIGGTFTGPALANFLGSALTAIQSYARGTGNDLVVGANAAPVAAADGLNRPNTTKVAKVLKSDLLGNDSDADSDPLTLTAVGNAQPPGATVAIAGNFVVYTAPANNAGNGSFTYTLSAGAHTVTGTVTVTETSTSGGGGGTPNYLTLVSSGDDFIVTFLGVPAGSFRVQYSTAGPPNYDWQEFAPPAIYTAPPNGVFSHTDVNPPDPVRFYRAIANP